METLSKFSIKNHHQPLFFSLHHNNPPFSFSKPNTIAFPKPRFSPIQINSNLSSRNTNPKTPNPLSFLKTPLTIAVATTAIFLSGWSHKPLSAVATTPPPATEEKTVETISDEEAEKGLEDYVAENPNDVEALKSLMEVRIKTKKLAKAVEVLNKLIEIDPEEKEWKLLRAHMYNYMGETEMAKTGFEEILSKDPLRVEAFHGLVMAVSQGEEENGGTELNSVVERINDAIEKRGKDKNTIDVRDFRLLIAQVRVIEGNYDEAMRVYDELVKEEPRDFRPYLCRGIIYTLLRKKDDAQKQFDTYKRLVPRGHPYAQYFDDNMLATKMFSQMAENERAGVGARA